MFSPRLSITQVSLVHRLTHIAFEHTIDKRHKLALCNGAAIMIYQENKCFVWFENSTHTFGNYIVWFENSNQLFGGHVISPSGATASLSEAIFTGLVKKKNGVETIPAKTMSWLKYVESNRFRINERRRVNPSSAIKEILASIMERICNG